MNEDWVWWSKSSKVLSTEMENWYLTLIGGSIKGLSSTEIGRKTLNACLFWDSVNQEKRLIYALSWSVVHREPCGQLINPWGTFPLSHNLCTIMHGHIVYVLLRIPPLKSLVKPGILKPSTLYVVWSSQMIYLWDYTPLLMEEFYYTQLCSTY